MIHEAFLAFGGNTWDDVERVEFPGIVAAQNGMINGQNDGAVGVINSTTFQNLDASPKGIYFPEFPHDDKEAWARMQKVAPFMTPLKVTVPIGPQKGKEQDLVVYAYPVLAGLDGVNEDLAYIMAKVIHETYDSYKSAHPDMPNWEISKAITVDNMFSPFYEGAIRYFKEIGHWTDEMEARQKELLEREEKLLKARDEVVKEAEAKGLSEDEMKALWTEKAKGLN